MMRNLILSLLLFLIFGYTIKQENTTSTVLKGAKIFIGNGEVIEEGIIIISEGKMVLPRI